MVACGQRSSILFTALSGRRNSPRSRTVGFQSSGANEACPSLTSAPNTALGQGVKTMAPTAPWGWPVHAGWPVSNHGSVPHKSTSCLSLLIEPLMDGFPGTHLRPVAYPFQRHRCFLPKPQRWGHLHRVALAPQLVIVFSNGVLNAKTQGSKGLARQAATKGLSLN